MDSETLSREASEADISVKAARRRLVKAVRQAYASGMSQRKIAKLTGRSQPEIGRLLRFHGTSPHAKQLRAHRLEVLSKLEAHGMRDVRVFGSTAENNDSASSDIDLLVSIDQPIGLLSQSKVEHELSEILGIPVDLVTERALRPDLRQRILDQAVPL